MCNKLHLLGFGMIEVMVALGLFAVIGVTGITMVTHSFSVNRLGDEQTIATNLATQGLEISRGIRSQGWNFLRSGNYGLQKNAGIWSFSSSPETWNKYTRTITVSDGQRDGSGNIVDSGGLVDPDLKKVASTVTFSTSPTRHNSVVLIDYLTNFSKNIPTNSGEGIIVYGDTTTTPKWRYYTNSTNLFSAEANTLTNESALNVIVKTSPIKSEAIAAYTSSAGTLHVLCYNGSGWSEDWSVFVGGTGATRRFDIAYENTTGKAMVVYSTNNTSTNELGYRTKSSSTSCGSAGWNTAANLDPARTSEAIQWVHLVSDNRSGVNNIALAWADSASDLSSMFWNGSSWVNEPSAVTESSLEIISTVQDIEDFDLEYESVSGNLMLIWSNSGGGNSVRYRSCTGGTATCTWGVVTTPPIFADDAANLTIAADPGSNDMVFASIGNSQSDLQIGYWNGATSTWTNTANVDTSCTTPVAGRQKIVAGFLRSGATVRSIVMYDDQGAGNIGWYVGNAGVFTAQTDFVPTPTFANNQGYYQFAPDPKNSDRGIFIVADNSNDLFGKRLVMNATPTFSWTNSDASVALELNLPQVISSPFNFAYWRN